MGRRGKGILAVLAVIGVFTVLLAVSVFGNEPEAPLPGILVGPQSGKLLLAAEGEVGPYIVSTQDSGAALTSLNAATGEAVQITLGYPLLGAASRNSHIVAFAEDEAGFFRTVVFTGGLETLRDEIAGLTLDELALYDCTEKGCLYTVPDGEEDTLYYNDTPYKFDSAIHLLHITERGQLWVCTENSYYTGDAENPENLHPFFGGVPERVLCSNVFLDAEGNVWRIAEGEPQAAVTGIPIQNLCSADESGVVYADDTGRIHKILWGGGELGACRVEGEILSLTSKGVLYQYEGSYYYAVLDFTPQEEEPAPSWEPSSEPIPSLEPSLEPVPSLEPSFEPVPSLEPSFEPTPSLEPSEGPEWLDVRDGFLYITGEVSVEELRTQMFPQDFTLETPEGERVTGGSLATGMLLRWSRYGTEGMEARIIVWGDCDGNGRIDGKDMGQAQSILLEGGGSVEEWYFLAADHDEDGEITARDLLWLSGELEKSK